MNLPLLAANCAGGVELTFQECAASFLPWNVLMVDIGVDLYSAEYHKHAALSIHNLVSV